MPERSGPVAGPSGCWAVRVTGMRRIGFMSAHNPYDRRSFSGVPYYMLRALRAHSQAEVTVLGNHPQYLPGLAGRVQRKLARRPSPAQAHLVVPEGLDCIVSVVSSALLVEHARHLDVPVLHVTDATPNFLRQIYSRDIPAEDDQIEAACLEAAAATVYSSDYMAARALQEFAGIDPEQTHAFPFGLNLDEAPKTVPVKPPLDRLNLLFIGGDWLRKGGPLAVQVIDALRASHIDATLTVIGNTDAEKLKHPHVRCLGFVDKNTPIGRKSFARELTQAHFLLHPTRADCSAMVVAEANAYGCPVAVTDVGGIPSVMAPEKNGRMFALEDNAAQIADILMSMMNDRERYDSLSESSRTHFEMNLTWERWVERLFGVVDDVLARAGSKGPG